MITGCSPTELEKPFDQNDVKRVTTENKSVEVSNDMSLLKASDKIAQSTIPYTLVKSFDPDGNFVKYKNVKDDDFLYLQISDSQSKISGDLIIENARENKVKFQTLFLQGNETVQIKPHSSEEWSRSLKYDVPPKTTITINIDINWDKNGMQELTFLPIGRMDKNEQIQYGNKNLSNYRFFVQSKDLIINDELLNEQAFELDQEELSSINLYPSPSWIGRNKNISEFTETNGEIFTNDPVKGIKLDAIPYDTSIDVILVDEFGNSTLLTENVKVKKNKKTIIPFEQKILDSMYNQDMRQFIMIINNRGEEMLADWRTLDLHKKPFYTSYQGILEFYQTAE